MKTKLFFTIITILLIVTLTSFTKTQITESDSKEAIKELIVNSYINGAFNELNADAMREGFHQDFAIFSAKGEDISKYPIGVWAEGTAKRKADPKFDASQNQWSHNFASIDVTGGSAAVKIELSKDGRLVYTDYLSLLQFDSGWKIVAKVYHEHKNK